MQFNFEQELKKLNPQQLEAVNTIYGPVLMIAGPGAGKTHVLSMRIANIIKSTDADPSNITALTFTESAARNMKLRLRKMIGKSANKINITTFHGFCNDLIQANKDIFQFSQELIQLDELTRIKFLQEILSELELKELKKFNLPYLYIKDIIREISNIKRAGLSPAEFANIVKIHKEKLAEPEISSRTGKPTTKWKKYEKQIKKNIELSEIYEIFQQKLEEGGYYDFDDMLILVNQELRNNLDFLAEIREKYQFFLVDEYQDTNGAQNNLLLTINSFDDQPNLFVVGDDDQAIYSFQGANLQNLLDFKEKYPSAKVITTKYNYRSVQEILDQSSELISNNKERFTNRYPEYDKKLISGNTYLIPPTSPVEIIKFDSNFTENQWIIDKIKKLISQGIPTSEIAVIYRNHKDADDIITGLITNDIEFQTESNNNILNLQVITNFISILKVINNPLDTNSYLKYIQNYLDISRINKLKLYDYIGNKTNSSLAEVISDPVKLKLVGINSESDINKLINNNDEIFQLNNEVDVYSASALIAKLIDKLNLLNSDIDAKNINLNNAFFSLWQYAKSRAKSKNKYTLTELLNDLEDIENNKLSINYLDINQYKTGVNLITAHRSKGLEFEYVFITKLIKGNWDNKRASSKLNLIPLSSENSDFEQIEEERRLLFVALTRAKLKLFLTFSEKYYLEDQNIQEKEESEFITELKNIEIISIKNTNTNLQENIIKQDSISNEDKLQFIKDVDLNTFLKTRISNYRLSASGLKDYQECPLRFLFQHILRVPKQESPYLILGTALHKALEFLYKNTNANLEKIIEIGIKYIDNQDLSLAEYKEIREEMIKIITEYYNVELEGEIEPGKVLAVEKNFSKNIYFENIPLSGKIDLIEWSELNPIDKKIKIIDFKSGKPQTKNTILGNTKNQTYVHYYQQLLFYVIMLDNDPFFNYNIESAELRFLRPKPNSTKYITLEFDIDQSKIIALKEEIKQVYGKIQNLEFSNKCNRSDCQVCNFVN